MPRYNNVLAGLAVLALAFATGAEAVVCNADHYLEMDGAYVSGSAANAPKCTPCPSNMKNPAGVTGGYGDSAAPRYAANVAAAVAATSPDNNLLTWCNVPEGYYLSTATSAELPGAVTVCPTAATTGVAQTISGTVTQQTAAVQCLGKSTCAADKYLELNGAYTASPSVANALQCTACPTGMTAPATPVVTVAAAKIAHTGIAAASAKTEVITNCNVPAGYYLSTATSSTSPGAVTACPAAFNGQATTGIEQIIPPTTAVGVQTPFSHCVQKSTCAADQYLKNSGGWVTGGGGVISKVYAKSTVTIGSEIMTLASHGFKVNQKLRYNRNGPTTGDQLMTPLTEGQLVFVQSVATNDVKLSLTKGGSVIDITNAGDDAQSFTPDFTIPKASITKTTGSIELDEHGLIANQQLIYQQDGTGTLAAPLTDGQIVFIKTRTDDHNFIISATKGGAAITFTSDGHDTQKFTPVYANPPQCNACPAGMTAPAAPDISSKASIIYAATGSGEHTANTGSTGSGAIDDKMITFCNVPAGSFLSANVVDQLGTGSSPGAVTSCLDDARFMTTTSPAAPVTAAVSASSAVLECTKISLCAANEYLESDGGYQIASSPIAKIDNKLVCTACPTDMTALAGPLQGTLDATGSTAVAAASVNNDLATNCHVPDSFWLSTAASATHPGAVTACGTAYAASQGTTLSIGTTAKQVQNVACIVPATKGATGATGATGAAGAAGAAGSAGSAGAAGLAGVSPAAPLSTLASALIGALVPAMIVVFA